MNAGELGVRSITDRMLSVTRRHDMDMLAELITRLIGRHSPQRHLFEPVLLELVALIGRALQDRADRAARDENEMFVVDVLDDSDDDCAAVGIDEIQPALRAILRAVLATLNDDGDDARFQVGLVADDPDPLARLDAVVHALRWANGLGEDAR
ncbi:hypothetical protein [Qaidamihabitans albus]|uniref:hypothetical protein n=1 Tax=Qaidamihabitans albus TaxID=2795733 RepID=UPI0027DCDE85|nr:hypothetical protein [Qaidamihabitans albus]